MVLPETDIENARQLAERIRIDFEQHHFFQKNGLGILITCSIGATEHQSDQTQASLLNTVDRLLYNAKDLGRSRVMVNEN